PLPHTITAQLSPSHHRLGSLSDVRHTNTLPPVLFVTFTLSVYDIHTHTDLLTHSHTVTHAHTHTHTVAHTSTHTLTHIHTHTLTHIHTHTYTHPHTHLHT